MKIRHVRAIAVFGIAVFALTGARGSSGGGCSSSSSSSSSSGGSHSDSDYDDDYDSDYDSTSGSSTTGGSVTGGSTADAGRDLTIDSCKYDTARGFVAEVTANNSGSVEYSYSFTVDFTDSAGATVGNTVGSIPDVLAGGTKTIEVTAVDLSNDDGASGGECKVDNVVRLAT
ncbi:hypothetical protein GCM10011583_51530 [Streptomyces camponoticapitis]|uniref:Uncharacterized protein n=1 Tax=Streptomyces camponoticapitis TaxID=1616125 RepID=A0ABQ2EMK3_9ACTN|nr:hypothetical protein [Streptomyces camponoticapitis]GGK13257.1 hypothetical protein GCM10011583_51530 [Streptomyces camponoticapitis]